ncbi:MAG: alpha/beta hydrolase, partial [Desulfosalsimonas sp.]
MSSSVKTSTGHLPAHDGTRLFVRQFFPESRIRAGVVIAHGLGEHSGRYRSLAEIFTRSDILVTAFDHRGHGQSDGKRGHVNRFSDYILDLGRVTRQSSGDNPGSTPLFILGHSMGGLIA